MTVLTILRYPDPRLRTVAKEVTTVDDSIRTLIRDMLETMYEASGIGLAATQVNVHKRILVADISSERDKPIALINPVIKEHEGEQTFQEGCLSVPGFSEDVDRFDHITISALNQDGESFEFNCSGLLSVCIQHEIDHLNGKLFVDYISNLKRQRIKKQLEKAKNDS